MHIICFGKLHPVSSLRLFLTVAEAPVFLAATTPSLLSKNVVGNPCTEARSLMSLRSYGLLMKGSSCWLQQRIRATSYVEARLGGAQENGMAARASCLPTTISVFVQAVLRVPSGCAQFCALARRQQHRIPGWSHHCGNEHRHTATAVHPLYSCSSLYHSSGDLPKP